MLLYHLLGRHPKNPGRREPNGKDDAALTLEELEICIVEIILDLNNEPVPSRYIPAEALTFGSDAITHIGLFRWGLNNRAGFTRSLDPKSVFSALLAKAKASVTSRGIHFQKQYFLSPRLIELGYNARAANSGVFEIEIRYDDHFADQVWFYDPILKEWVPAMNDNEETRRLRASFLELENFRREQERLALQAKAENVHRKHQKSKQINTMTKRAAQEAKEQREGLPKSSDAGIRKNKLFDQAAEDAIKGQRALDEFGPATTSARHENTQGVPDNSPAPLEQVGNAARPAASITRELWRELSGRMDR